MRMKQERVREIEREREEMKEEETRKGCILDVAVRLACTLFSEPLAIHSLFPWAFKDDSQLAKGLARIGFHSVAVARLSLVLVREKAKNAPLALGNSGGKMGEKRRITLCQVL